MTREEYLAHLAKYYSFSTKPTQADFKNLCPHLNDEQIERAKTPGWGLLDSEFAAPPVIVRNAFTTLGYSPDRKTLGIRSWRRLPDWYDKMRADGEKLGMYLFVDEAVDYARQTWPEALVEDTWVDCGGTMLFDPTNESADPIRYNKPKVIFRWFTNKPWKEVVSDPRYPDPEYVDEHIVEVITHPHVALEMKGYREERTLAIHCSLCGTTLNSECCPKCGVRYPREKKFYDQPKVPLTPKMLAAIKELGHTFERS